MSGPEGWDGESVRQHVLNARSDAAEGIDLARGALDEIEELKARLDELTTKVGATQEPDEKPLPPRCAVNSEQAAKFSKVQVIWDEISRWRRFVHEVHQISAALDKWDKIEIPQRGNR